MSHMSSFHRTIKIPLPLRPSTSISHLHGGYSEFWLKDVAWRDLLFIWHKILFESNTRVKSKRTTHLTHTAHHHYHHINMAFTARSVVAFLALVLIIGAARPGLAWECPTVWQSSLKFPSFSFLLREAWWSYISNFSI